MSRPDLDPPPSGLQATDYVRHLWARRFWIVGIAFAVLVGTYLGIRFFHPNLYDSSALILVRQQPRLSNIENDKPGIDPPAFRNMFKSDEVIEAVRRQYNQMVREGFFVNSAGSEEEKAIARAEHEEIKSPLEKLRARFRTTSVTTVDTTISTEFSPVIELTFRGSSRGQALAVMQLWSQQVLTRYGNLLNEEAQFLIESSSERTEALRGEAEEIAREKARLEVEKSLVDARLASALRQLTRAPLPKSEPAVGSNEIIGYNMYSGPRRSSMTIEQIEAGAEPGLWERLTQVELEIAKTSEGTEEADRLAAERARLLELIPEVESRIETESERAAELESQIAAAAVELNRLEYAVRLNSTVASQASAMLRAVDPESEKQYERYGTLRMLADPVLPNLRVWPKRTLLAALAGGIVFVLTIVVFCFELYLRAAMRERPRAETPTDE